MFKLIFGSFGAFPVFDDLLSSFSIFYLASDKAASQGPWGSYFVSQYVKFKRKNSWGGGEVHGLANRASIGPGLFPKILKSKF